MVGIGSENKHTVWRQSGMALLEASHWMRGHRIMCLLTNTPNPSYYWGNIQLHNTSFSSCNLTGFTNIIECCCIVTLEASFRCSPEKITAFYMLVSRLNNCFSLFSVKFMTAVLVKFQLHFEHDSGLILVLSHWKNARLNLENDNKLVVW